MKEVTEINITPVKPQNGLIAFCSFILYESIYCGSVAIFTRPDGSYRLVYPTKKTLTKDIDIFHPINKTIGRKIEHEISKKLNDVMKHDRHYINHN